MLKRYEEFLKEVDRELNGYFKDQQQYIKCRQGCVACCTLGEYPFSRLEAEYLMQGFQGLPKDTRDAIRENIRQIKLQKENFYNSAPVCSKSRQTLDGNCDAGSARFLYKCPFLINNLCSLYSRRGLTCRMFGLAYLREGRIILPECANSGLNYCEVFDKSTGMVNLQNPVKKNLNITTWLNSDLAEKYALEAGEIRTLIDWF